MRLTAGPGEHARGLVVGGLGARVAEPAGEFERAAEPPAGHVADRLRRVYQRIEQPERVGLRDLDRLFGAAAAPTEQVVHAVGVHPHRGDRVIRGDEGDDLARHLVTLGP